MGFKTSLSWAFGTGRPYTRLYGFDLSIEVPEETPTTTPGTAHTIYQRPYEGRLPIYHRLDVSIERSFEISEQLMLETRVGTVNTYDRRNIFFYDIDQLQRVDQSPLLPYASLKIRTK
jgi:hypothetical protein